MNARSIKLVGEPFSEEDVTNLVEWLRQKPTPQLSQGPLVREFEEKFAAWLGRKHAVMVNSGSSALFAAYASVRLRGSAVVPSVAWPTTVSPLIQLGWRIGLASTQSDWSCSVSHVDWLCSQMKPNVVTVVDVLGVPANRDALLELRTKHQFVLIEDCCGAHASAWMGQKVGTFGDLACFSFHVNHALTTIEGGMVVTDDPEYAKRLRIIRAHGWAADLGDVVMREMAAAESPPVDPFRVKFTFYAPGMNLRSTDLQARIGLSQLSRLQWVVEQRAVNDARYRRRLREIPGVETQSFGPGAYVSSIAVGILVPDRAKVAEALVKAGVETRPIGGGNMRRQPFWLNTGVLFTSNPHDRIAEAVHDRGLQLPNHPDLTDDDIEYVCAAVREGVLG